MAKQVKIRRGTTAEHDTFTGVMGEVTFNTTSLALRLHNGSTVGGIEMARADGANASGSWGISITGNAAGLTGTLGISGGGTGATSAAVARSNLGAAGAGNNTDITSLQASTIIFEVGTVAAESLGFRGLPQNAKTAAYTLQLGDAGKHISITTGGVTIPANSLTAFPIGTTIVVYNDSATPQNISINTDTLRHAGTTTTGTLSLAGYGLATLVKVKSNVWVVS